MSNLVNVFLYYRGERIGTPYGMEYWTRRPIRKVRITPDTTYARLVTRIYEKLNLRHGVYRVWLSQQYQTSVVASVGPYFGKSTIVNNDDVVEMFRIACQPNEMSNAQLSIDITREGVYIP